MSLNTKFKSFINQNSINITILKAFNYLWLLKVLILTHMIQV